MLWTKCVGRIKTQIVFFFSPRYSCLLWDNGGKYGRAGQARGDRKYAICIPDN